MDRIGQEGFQTIRWTAFHHRSFPEHLSIQASGSAMSLSLVGAIVRTLLVSKSTTWTKACTANIVTSLSTSSQCFKTSPIIVLITLLRISTSPSTENQSRIHIASRELFASGELTAISASKCSASARTPLSLSPAPLPRCSPEPSSIVEYNQGRGEYTSDTSSPGTVGAIAELNEKSKQGRKYRMWTTKRFSCYRLLWLLLRSNHRKLYRHSTRDHISWYTAWAADPT